MGRAKRAKRARGRKGWVGLEPVEEVGCIGCVGGLEEEARAWWGEGSGGGHRPGKGLEGAR